jgi:predicted XRE-type DNA-binding protein
LLIAGFENEITQKGRSKMTTKRKIAKKASVTASSGNVFADLGLPKADQELMKARLTLQIYRIIQARGLTQTEAGKILGIPQPHVSALARNRSGNFSVGRLIDFLTALGQDVKITVTPARKLHGQMSVEVA